MGRFNRSAGRVLKGLGRLTGAVALAAGLTTSAAHASQYTAVKAITLPANATDPTGALTSVDIGYVDTTLGMYYLAQRDVAGIVAVNTNTNAATIIGGGQFQGIKASNVSGPNGVITVNHTEVWGGDGNGQIRVYNATTGALITTIGPTIGTLTATQRADEACWDPQHNVVVWAWDEPGDLFIAFISTTTHTVLKTIKFDGLAGDGPNATNGIEQCQWDARTNLIYLNLPEVNGPADDSVPGMVVVLNGATQSIVKTFTIPVANCNGPQGMAIGPRNEIALNCSRNATTGNGNGSVVINEQTGAVLATFPTIWGGDEMFYEAGAAHYAFTAANDKPAQLDFAAAANDTEDQSITVAASEHSVAADYVHRQIYFPVINSAAAQAEKLCSSVGGNDSLGCILVLQRQ